MATVFNPATFVLQNNHRSTVEEANTLAKSLELVGYNCKTKDEEGMPALGLLLVKGGEKRPRLIVEINHGDACGLPELAVAVRTERPEFGHHYDWVSGAILRTPEDGPALLREAFQTILEIAGENPWRKNVRENRGRDADDESYR